jgi:hypothetical protein
MDTADHLLGKEGIDGMAEAGKLGELLEITTFVARADTLRKLGTGFGD